MESTFRSGACLESTLIDRDWMLPSEKKQAVLKNEGALRMTAWRPFEEL